MELNQDKRFSIIEKACQQVGPGVFYSTIIIVTSFLPVFLLTGQEGKLFSPLAWTKTFILLIDAFIAITLVPVLISFFLKGKLKPESTNPLTRGMERIYTPILKACLRWRKTTIGINLVALLISIPMMLSLGSEFMPPLDEGTILFMPVTLQMLPTMK
jgi:Cu(I)/Ag(I) efflux system membrane protein CusA/SilA